MNRAWFCLSGLLLCCVGLGCATTGGGAAHRIPVSELDRAKVIVAVLPVTLRSVKQDLWERAMVGFGLEQAMIERVSHSTGATIMTGRLAEDTLNPARATAAKQIKVFVEGVRQSPNASQNLPAVIRAQLAAHPMAEAPDFILAGWISRFDVTSRTQSFAGPFSGQSRDCRVRGEVALYDVKQDRLYRNRGDGKWSVKAMAMVVSPTNVITDFDLSAASRASQEALTKAIDNLLSGGAE